jgi:hypothetical protein
MIVTEGVQHKLDTLKMRVQNQTICYIDNPALPVPSALLSASLVRGGLVAEISVKDVYLLLRLLTDNAVDDTDPEGNTLLHLASSSGNKDAIYTAVKSGASVTLTNKEGYTPFTLALGRFGQIKMNKRTWHNVKLACENNDTSAVKMALCLFGDRNIFAKYVELNPLKSC